MRRTPAEPWTVREIGELEEFRLRGHTIAELALRFCRTRDSIRAMLAKTGAVGLLKITRYAAVLANGKSRAEQAEELGLSIHSVKRARLILRRLGILHLPDQRRRRRKSKKWRQG